MNNLVCPFMSKEGAEKNCIEERCMLWVEGENLSSCTFTKMPRKEVARLDTVSAQLAEMQVGLNLIVDKL